MEWLRDGLKLENILGLPNKKMMEALRKVNHDEKFLKMSIFLVNLQVPILELNNTIFYYVIDNPILVVSLFYHFYP
jgi:hypothetical protein